GAPSLVRLMRRGRRGEEVVVDRVGRGEHAARARSEAGEELARPRSHAEVAVEEPEADPRGRSPERAAPPRRRRVEGGVAPIQDRNASPPAREERAHERDGVPAGDERDVRPRLDEGRGDLRDVEAPEVLAPEALRTPGRAEYARAIPPRERRVPRKRHA